MNNEPFLHLEPEAAEIHTRVARLAYQYFEERGGIHGYDQLDWLRAESALRQSEGTENEPSEDAA